MFFKLALKNVTKSIKDYTIYFLTMTFGVCLFYMFNSIDSQTAMMQLSAVQSESIKMLSQSIAYVSIFISVILGFLIVYANQFLIKRRKKELGIYMTLGMEKGKISRIVILETFLIGVFSLAVGLLVGIFASQGLSVLTAKMFEVNLKAFQFTFSIQAFYKTLLYFSIIFLIVMIFNAVSISKLKLIDLLTAGKKNESLKIKRLWISVVLFLVSIACLGAAYYFITKNGMMGIDNEFTAAIALGSIGTLLFFLSLSGFLLRVVQTNKRLYYKNMNMFVLRQINSKINTTFVSMSVICIMLLITIGTLSTGMGLADVLTKTMNSSTPYDVSFSYNHQKDDAKKQVNDIAQKMKADKIDLDKYAKDYAQINAYTSNVQYGDLYSNDSLFPQGFGDVTRIKKLPVAVVSLTDYNNVVRMQGKPTLELKDNEFAVNCNFSQILPLMDDFLKTKAKVTLSGKELTCTQKAPTQISFSTTMSEQDTGTLIVPDALTNGLKIEQETLNVNYKTGVNEQEFFQQLETVYNKADMKSEKIDRPYDMEQSKMKMHEQGAGLKTMVSYLAIYIGLVFLITSAAVLALQQLSEASDNAERYGLLKKLGAEESMVNHALFSQIAIYFFLPLSLAIIHSIVGIKVANNVVSLLGGLDILGNTIFTAAIFLVIYGGYFLATYFGSKSMIRQNRN
ncbi:MAG: putative transporter [Caproiciproducens sp.]|nr:putative transporter [Caproiciproducens sp.]